MSDEGWRTPPRTPYRTPPRTPPRGGGPPPLPPRPTRAMRTTSRRSERPRPRRAARRIPVDYNDDDEYSEEEDAGPLGDWEIFRDALPSGPPTTRERGLGMTRPVPLHPVLHFAVVYPRFGRDSDYALGRLAAEALYSYRHAPEETEGILVSLRVAIEAYVIFIRSHGSTGFEHDRFHTPFDRDEENPFDTALTPDEYATSVVDDARFALGLMADNDRRAATMWDHLELVLAYLEMLRLHLWMVAGRGMRWTGPMPYNFEAMPARKGDGDDNDDDDPSSKPYVRKNRGLDLTRLAPPRVPVRQNTQRPAASMVTPAATIEAYARARTQTRGYKKLLGVLMQSSLLED